MTLVMVCWVLAMISGLAWSRQVTAVFTAATIVAAAWSQPFLFLEGAGWVQVATLGITPWLLAGQRARKGLSLKQLRAGEAVQLAQLSEAARGLLSLQHSTQQVEAQIAEITDLYHVTKETSGALHLKDLFTASLTIAPGLLNARGLRFIDLSGEAPQVLRATRSPDGRMVPSADGGTAADDTTPSPQGGGTGRILEMERAIIREVLSSGRPSSATAQELSCAVPSGLSRVSWAPFWRERQPVGVLIADELPHEQLKTLSIVANQLSLQFSRIHLYQQVEALAVTDALTGLSVRGYFLERAREELARSTRHGLSCVVLMADLDRFKDKNDTFGHLVGDVVLKEVARLLRGGLREIDLIARFGGEEFLLLLTETAIDQAMPVAQRLRQLVEVHPIRAYDELLTQTISLGAAVFPDHADTLEGLIERADQALYAAKRAGRNQAVLWSSTLSAT